MHNAHPADPARPPHPSPSPGALPESSPCEAPAPAGPPSLNTPPAPSPAREREPEGALFPALAAGGFPSPAQLLLSALAQLSGPPPCRAVVAGLLRALASRGVFCAGEAAMFCHLPLAILPKEQTAQAAVAFCRALAEQPRHVALAPALLQVCCRVYRLSEDATSGCSPARVACRVQEARELAQHMRRARRLALLPLLQVAPARAGC
jgi:hypothetical protein